MTRFKTVLLAGAASLALIGAAAAQTGRSSTNPEAGPAGASTGAQMSREQGAMPRRGMRSTRSMRHSRRMRHHRRPM